MVGPRGLYELQQGATLEERLEAYARLAELAPFIAALGGAELPTLRPIGESRAAPTRVKARARSARRPR